MDASLRWHDEIMRGQTPVMFTRRTFIAGAAATAFAAPAILRAQGWRRYPFSLGVAAGDPSPDGFVIWTRLAPEPLDQHGGMAMQPVPVDLGGGLGRALRHDRRARRGGGAARARPSRPCRARRPPARPAYWYRFGPAGERSINGRARTLPLAASSPQALRFGVAGCQAWDDGYYTAYAPSRARGARLRLSLWRLYLRISRQPDPARPRRAS